MSASGQNNAHGKGGWSRRLEQLDQDLAAVGAGSGGRATRDDGAADGIDVVDDRAAPEDNGHRAAPVAGDGPLATADARPTAAPADDRPGVDAFASAGDGGARGAQPGDGDEDGNDDGNDDEDAEHDGAAKRRRAFLDWVVVIGVALFVAFLVRTFVLAHFVVDGVSMTSTLQDEDRVFVNKLSYRLHEPNRGDVVVLHQLNGTSERDLIKRVVGLPGESIQYQSCQVLIDGRALEEPYLDPEAMMPGSCGRNVAPVAIPEDHVFVMGDNRGGSMDSRDLGPIDEDELVGRAFVVFWPSSHWQWL